MNARMADLRRCFESAGFSDVTTVLSSGNVAFDARSAGPATLEKKAEAAMARELDHVFGTIVRPVKHLQRLLANDPYEHFDIAPAAKRIVTFLRRPTPPNRSLPVELDGARILCVAVLEVFSAYVPGTKGPVFMSLIEKTFGKDVTTRTLETIRKCAAT